MSNSCSGVKTELDVDPTSFLWKKDKMTLWRTLTTSKMTKTPYDSDNED